MEEQRPAVEPRVAGNTFSGCMGLLRLNLFRMDGCAGVAVARHTRCGGRNARHTFVEENRGEMILWRWRAILKC
jgi:hypothetical protein